MLLFLPKAQTNNSAAVRLDAASACSRSASARFQMMLDRGQDKDWFSSSEIIIEAVLGGLGVYLFVVHMLTAEKPFIPPRIFKDRNFVASLATMFMVGMVLLASSALLAPYLQMLANYPVATAGLMLAPRGIGTMAAMMIAGRLSARASIRAS